ncbi:MAG: caspase domain-containing protein [Deferribacterales bacterium]
MLRLLIITLITLACLPLYGQERAIKSSAAAVNINADELYSESAAFVAGVYDYSGGWPDLPGVRMDIDAVSESLRSAGFTVDEYSNLTKTGFKNKLEQFLNKYKNIKNARLLVYYAGHGHTMTEASGKTGYIVLKDAKLPSKDVGGFKEGSIPMTYFSERAEDLRQRSVLFVFDSCFSGTVFSSMRSVPELMLELLQKPVRQFISSGSEDEMVPDVSIFRERFIGGIAGDADTDGNSVITGSELGEYLRDSVTHYSAGTQTPMYGKLRGYDGEFVFMVDKKPEGQTEKKIDKRLTEKERLIEKIKENPHSPDAEKYVARLREIDESLNIEPPVTAPERKDFTMTAKSTVIRKDAPNYPFIIIAPIAVETKGKTYKAAFRVTANNPESFKKLNDRKYMLKSVMTRRLKESNLQAVDDIFEFRTGIKREARNAVDWVCPNCSDESPAIAGLAGL